MINRPTLLPTNRHVRTLTDHRWPLAFAMLAMVSVLLAATLALIGWPRLRSMSLHYELVGLRSEVERLSHLERRVETELEALRAPQTITDQAEALGLIAPPTSAIETRRGGER